MGSVHSSSGSSLFPHLLFVPPYLIPPPLPGDLPNLYLSNTNKSDYHDPSTTSLQMPPCLILNPSLSPSLSRSISAHNPSMARAH